MAAIREELSLFDKFSGVFEKFLNMGNRAASQSEAVEAATQQMSDTFAAAGRGSEVLAGSYNAASAAAEQMSSTLAASAQGADIFTAAYNEADQAIKKTLGACDTFADELNVVGQSVSDYGQYWTSAAGNFDKGAMSAVNSLQDLVDKGYMSQSAIAAMTDAAEAAATKQALLAEAAANGTAEQQALAQTVQSQAVAAFEAASSAVSTAIDPLAKYTAELKITENQLTKNSVKLQEMSGEYSQLVQAKGAASVEAEKLRVKIETLTASTFGLLDKQRELKNQIDAAANSGGKAGKAIKESGNAATKAADGGLSSLLKKLTSIAAAYLSVQKASQFIAGAMKEQTYEVKMQGIFGDDAGTAAMTWVRNTANEMGRATSEIAKATADFSKFTTQPVNLDKFNKLSDKLARFSDGNDFGQMSNAVMTAFSNGSMRGLTSATKISGQIMKQFKVDDLIKAGDVGGALDALNKAAEAAGMTQEAYEKLTDTAEAKWSKFCANMENGATKAAGAFLNAFAPVFDKFNQWVQSEQAQKFFNAITIAARIAGEVIGKLVGIAMGFVNFLTDNLPVTIGLLGFLTLAWAAAGQAAVIAGTKAAIAWIAANWQLALVAGLVAGAVAALMYLGETGKWVVMIIGVLVLAYAAWQIAQWALNTAMYACPIVWILIAVIAVIALVVMAIYFFRDQFIVAMEAIVGAVFWLGVMFYNVGMAIGNFFIWLWAKIVNGWNYSGAQIMTIFSNIGAGISNFINDVGYWFSSVGVTIANAFISGANAAINAINWIIDAINLIPGVNIGHASTFAEMAAPAKAASVQATDYTKDFQEWQPEYLEYADMGAAFQQGASYGRSAGEATVGFIDGLVDAASNLMTMPNTDEAAGNGAFDNYADGLDRVGDDGGDVGKVGKVGKIEDAVKLDDEDLKLLVDMAEREYVNKVNVRTLAPNVKVEVNNNNGEPLSEHTIVAAIKSALDEQIANHTDISYSY
jgi:hypothetical protein